MLRWFLGFGGVGTGVVVGGAVTIGARVDVPNSVDVGAALN